MFAAVRTYFAARYNLDREVNTIFNEEAESPFEKNELDQLILRCRTHLEKRPNHAYARWYLARALLIQQQWSAALEQLTTLRGKIPDWADHIEPLIREARGKLEGREPSV